MHRICPECHSDHVIIDMFLITGKYTCLDCGYKGAFIMTMDDENYEKLLEEDREDQKSSHD